MSPLSKRLEIRVESSTLRFLHEISKKRHESIGQLVRSAVKKLYLQNTKKERISAASNLCNLNAPAADWDQMEAEIEGGRV